MEVFVGVIKCSKKRKHRNETSELTKSKSHSSSGLTKIKKIKKENVDDFVKFDQDASGFLTGTEMFILKAGSNLGRARYEMFTKQIIKNGGKVSLKITPLTTHIVVGEDMALEKLNHILNINSQQLPEKIVIVKANWLSESLTEQILLETNLFEIDLNKIINNCDVNKESKLDDNNINTNLKLDHSKVNVPPNCGLKWTSPKKDFVPENCIDSDESSYVPSDEDDYQQHLDKCGEVPIVTTVSTSSSKATNVLPKGDWACAKPSTSQSVNLNKAVTDKLQVLQNAYENTKDQWRALGYKKAIKALKKHPTEVTTWEEASKIPGVGAKLADKIIEILDSGHLRKIDHVCKGQNMEALAMLTNIWGVGPTTAQSWVQQGYCNLNDVRKNVTLTRQQTIGMKHYEEFLNRMPREEVAEIQKIVTETAHEINPDYVLTTCGSFRRGKPSCGDIDILVSHPDGKSHKTILGKLLDALRLKGILTDDLIRQEDNGKQRKYMGVCKLNKDNAMHRRLDIIVSPWDEYHCALVHFTGSDHFNRSLRALAIKKGMSLSEHALRHGVIRRGKEKIHNGTPLPVHSEKDVFTHLGLEYRPPHERDY